LSRSHPSSITSRRRGFCKHTGRSKYDPPPDGWKELVVIVGRQSGKTRIGSLIASYESAFGGDVEAGGGSCTR
jgi:hypothetical protein